MKIALFSPADFLRDPLKQAYGPTLGLAYLAGSVRRNPAVEDVSIQVDLDYLIQQKPDLIGISAYTEEFGLAVSAIEAIRKKLDVPIILGGHHITALPETLPEQVTLGVIGDGEEIFYDIVQLFAEGRLTEENYQDLSGIVFRSRNGKLINNGKRLFDQDLDFLAPPARDLFRAYHPVLGKNLHWYHRLYTSRGCPFSCIFCMYSKMRKRNMRYHSPERVISEIHEIIRVAPSQAEVFIADDLFVIDKNRLYEISRQIRSEGLNKKLSFSCLTRANVFDEEIALLLRSMNVTKVSFGFESGSDQVLRYLKGGVSVSHNQRAIEICEKYGLNTGAYLVTGSPEETISDLAKSYWFVNKNRYQLREISSFCIIPLPETQLWDYAVKEGFVNPDQIDWDRITYISLEKDKYIFMNKFYSLDDFKFAHNNYFRSFYDWCGYLELMAKKLERDYQVYKREFLKELITDNSEKNILEISPVSEILDFYQENINFIHFLDLSKYAGQKTYDLIFINNLFDHLSLEQLELFFSSLSEYIAENTVVKIFVNNIANFYTLELLLSGSFSSEYFKNHKFRFNYHYSKTKIVDFLKKSGFEPTSIISCSFPTEQEKKYSSFLELMEQNLGQKLPAKENLNIFGYLITVGFSRE